MHYEPVQMYQTTVVNPDGYTAVEFAVVPRRSLPEQFMVLTGSQSFEVVPLPSFVREELNLREMFRIVPDQLESALAVLLSDRPSLHDVIMDTSFEAARDFELRRLMSVPSATFLGEQAAEFANYLAKERIIPFEQSPLSALSLHDLLRATGSAIGAYAGFVISGSSPLLLITVPAGMIICGAASGVARGLEDGLKRRIVSMIGRRRSPRKSALRAKE